MNPNLSKEELDNLIWVLARRMLQELEVLKLAPEELLVLAATASDEFRKDFAARMLHDLAKGEPTDTQKVTG